VNGMIFGVYDKNDGSSFVLDMDKKERHAKKMVLISQSQLMLLTMLEVD
jgi:hypothetical protein